MAESVDALVSNTSGATRAGSTPALGTKKRLRVLQLLTASFFIPFLDHPTNIGDYFIDSV